MAKEAVVAPISPDLVKDKEPLVIRGHRLSLLFELSAWALSAPHEPQYPASEDFLLRNRPFLLESNDDGDLAKRFASGFIKEIKSFFQSVELRGYRQEDILGTTAKTEKLYRERIEKIFEQFLRLPDEHPLILTEAPDYFCLACDTGDHCQGYTHGEDRSRIERFLENTPEGETEVVVESYVFDNKKQEILSALTTLGTLRGYLSQEFASRGMAGMAYV